DRPLGTGAIRLTADRTATASTPGAPSVLTPQDADEALWDLLAHLGADLSDETPDHEALLPIEQRTDTRPADPTAADPTAALAPLASVLQPEARAPPVPSLQRFAPPPPVVQRPAPTPFTGLAVVPADGNCVLYSTIASAPDIVFQALGPAGLL